VQSITQPPPPPHPFTSKTTNTHTHTTPPKQGVSCPVTSICFCLDLTLSASFQQKWSLGWSALTGMTLVKQMETPCKISPRTSFSSTLTSVVGPSRPSACESKLKTYVDVGSGYVCHSTSGSAFGADRDALRAAAKDILQDPPPSLLFLVPPFSSVCQRSLFNAM